MALTKFKKRVKDKLLVKLLNGTNVKCNVCNHSFTTFLPYLNRINARCPNCNSLERVRLVKYFIDDLNLLDSNARILHVAPERCLYDIFSAKHGSNYTPGDMFEEGYSYPKGTIHMDVTQIPFEDETFDVVICLHVLEHVQDDRKALSEIYRVIKKGGSAILQVPYESDRATTYEDPSIVDPEERRKHFLQFDHVRIYGMDYLDRFKEPGFTLEHYKYEESLDQSVRDKYVFKNEDIFLLRK